MKSRLTVMFAVDVESGTYMIGDMDGSGTVVEFNAVRLHRVGDVLNRKDAFYLVVLAEDWQELSVSPIRMYKAYFRANPYGTVVEGVAAGTLDPLEAANSILAAFKRGKHGFN